MLKKLVSSLFLLSTFFTEAYCLADDAFMVKNYKLGCTVDNLKNIPFQPFPSTVENAELVEQLGFRKLEEFPSRPLPQDKTMGYGIVGDCSSDDGVLAFHSQLMSPNVHCYGYVPPIPPAGKPIQKGRGIAFLSYASHAVSPKFLTVWDGKTERLFRIVFKMVNPPGPVTVGYRTYQSSFPLPVEEAEYANIRDALEKKYGLSKKLRDGAYEWMSGHTRILFDQSKSLISFEDRQLKKFADPPPPVKPDLRLIDPEKAVKDM